MKLNLRSVLALGLAGTMAFSVTAFADEKRTTTLTPEDGDGTVVEGEGEVAYIDTNIYDVLLPTADQMHIYLDPQGLASAGDSVTGSDLATLDSNAGKVFSKNPAVIKNYGAVGVGVTATFSVKDSGESKLVANASGVDSDTDQNIYLTAVSSSKKVVDAADTVYDFTNVLTSDDEGYSAVASDSSGELKGSKAGQYEEWSIHLKREILDWAGASADPLTDGTETKSVSIHLKKEILDWSAGSVTATDPNDSDNYKTVGIHLANGKNVTDIDGEDPDVFVLSDDYTAGDTNYESQETPVYVKYSQKATTIADIRTETDGSFILDENYDESTDTTYATNATTAHVPYIQKATTVEQITAKDDGTGTVYLSDSDYTSAGTDIQAKYDSTAKIIYVKVTTAGANAVEFEAATVGAVNIKTATDVNNRRKGDRMAFELKAADYKIGRDDNNDLTYLYDDSDLGNYDSAAFKFDGTLNKKADWSGYTSTGGKSFSIVSVFRLSKAGTNIDKITGTYNQYMPATTDEYVIKVAADGTASYAFVNAPNADDTGITAIADDSGTSRMGGVGSAISYDPDTNTLSFTATALNNWLGTASYVTATINGTTYKFTVSNDYVLDATGSSVSYTFGSAAPSDALTKVVDSNGTDRTAGISSNNITYDKTNGVLAFTETATSNWLKAAKYVDCTFGTGESAPVVHFLIKTN